MRRSRVFDGERSFDDGSACTQAHFSFAQALAILRAGGNRPRLPAAVPALRSRPRGRAPRVTLVHDVPFASGIEPRPNLSTLRGTRTDRLGESSRLPALREHPISFYVGRGAG